jgi:hypothetical protein
MNNDNTGHFVWYELLTSDPKAAMAFYTEVVGWKTQPFQDDYTMWVGSQGPLDGVMTLPEQAKAMGAPPHWMASVQVADVDATAARAKELGGRVYLEPHDIPTVGRYAVIGDPQGAFVAVFKPGNAMTLHDRTKHGEVCWNELITTDQKAAFAFYQALFGWEHIADHDMGPMGTYLLYGRNGKQWGGMFNIMPSAPMPPAFLYYVQVHGLDAALDRAKRMGAKVMNGPMEVPGGARIVQLMDPQGAVFALHEEAAKPAT